MIPILSDVNTQRGPSGRIWNSCPLEGGSLARGVDGILFSDDFINAPVLSTSAATGLYASYADTGVTITQTAKKNGELALVQDGTDNDEAWIQAGGNTGAPFVISESLMYEVWLEARFKLSTVADDVAAIFIGFAEEGLAAANSKVDNTGVMADKDLLGFNSVHVNGGTAGTNALLNVTYNKASGTMTNAIANVQTMVADTYYKVGLHYNPWAPTSKRLAFFVDGVEQSTYLTSAQLAAAIFPAGEEMHLLAGSKAGAGTASTLTLDWWQAAMVTRS